MNVDLRILVVVVEIEFVWMLESEMEYCASATSMLAKEIWKIAEGFVEVSANLYAQLKKYGTNFSKD